MYALAGSAAPWPLCRYKIVLSTRASIAVEMPPLRAEMPEKREESPPGLLDRPANPIARLLPRARPPCGSGDSALSAVREREQRRAKLACRRRPRPLRAPRMHRKPRELQPAAQLCHHVQLRVLLAAERWVMTFALRVFLRLMCTEHVPSKQGTPYDVR